jgi:hypothetical protein
MSLYLQQRLNNCRLGERIKFLHSSNSTHMKDHDGSLGSSAESPAAVAARTDADQPGQQSLLRSPQHSQLMSERQSQLTSDLAADSLCITPWLLNCTMRQDSDKPTSNQKATPFQRPSDETWTFSCVSDSHTKSVLGSEVWVRAAPAMASTRCCRSRAKTGNGEDSRLCGTLQRRQAEHHLGVATCPKDTSFM